MVEIEKDNHIIHKTIGPIPPEEKERMMDEAAKRSAEDFKEKFIEKPKKITLANIKFFLKEEKNKKIESITREIFKSADKVLDKHQPEKGRKINELETSIDNINISFRKETCRNYNPLNPVEKFYLIDLAIGDLHEEPIMRFILEPEKVACWIFEDKTYRPVDEADIGRIKQIVDFLAEIPLGEVRIKKGAGDGGGTGPRPQV